MQLLVSAWKSIQERARALLALALFVNSCLATVHFLKPAAVWSVSPDDISPEIGLAYSIDLNRISGADLSEAWMPYDNGEHPRASRLELLYKGSPIEVSHAIHEDIRQIGDGRFSHWNRSVIFALPGNEDPKANALHLRLRLPFAWPLPVVLTMCLITGLTLAVWLPVTIRYALPLATGAGARVRSWLPPTILRALPDPVRRSEAPRIAGLAGVVLAAGLFLVGWSLEPRVLGVVPDSWGYLHPALQWASGRDLELIYGRTIGYPAGLGLMLKIGGMDFVPLLQTVAAAITVCFTLLGFNIAYGPMVRGRPMGGVFIGLVTLIGGIALFCYQPLINHAQSMATESLGAFSMSLAGLCLLVAVFTKIRPNALYAIVFLGAISAGFSLFVRPHNAAFAVLVWLGLCLTLFLNRKLRLWPRVAVAAAACGVIVFGLAAPQAALKDKYDPAGDLFGPVTFFCNHAPIVDSEVPDLIEDKKTAAKIDAILDKTVALGPNGWTTLGYNGDYCFYLSDLTKLLSEHFKGDIAQSRAFLMTAFLHGVRDDPLAYAQKVVRQVAVALSAPLYNYGAVFVHTRKFYDEFEQTGEYGRFALNHVAPEGADPKPLLRSAAPIHEFGRAVLGTLNKVAIPVLVLVVMFLLIDLLRWRLGNLDTARFVQSWLPICLIFGLYLSSVMIVAISHTFDTGRYLEAIAPTALLFHLAAVTQISFSSAALISVGKRFLMEEGGRRITDLN